MIFVSTGCFPAETAAATASYFLNNDINEIELSSGIADTEQLLSLQSMALTAKFQIHNYFPPPLKPFVFNLATPNPAIAEQSMVHVRKAMQWAIALGCSCYSFHAGFLIDPKVGELGGRLDKHNLYNRAGAFQRFVERVIVLSAEARMVNLDLLVENNVVTNNVLDTVGADPFLLTSPQECQRFMSFMPANVGLLLDVAHLKVSARSIGFDPIFMLNECNPFIYAYHLSDNDGYNDTNEPLRKESWFWPHLRKDVNYFTLEISGVTAPFLREQINLTKNILAGL